jgi:hypothetical protein
VIALAAFGERGESPRVVALVVYSGQDSEIHKSVFH